MNETRAHILIVGCGYVGRRLAARLLPDYDVSAIVRSSASASKLAAAGMRASVIDLDRVKGSETMPERLDQAAVFYLAPPPMLGESDFRLNRFLQLAHVPPRVFVYMSTTGVYGDTGGARVDESTPVQPQTERARRRVSAEEMTRVWCTERRVRRVVLRVPGIYGPGRLPLAKLTQREPVIRRGEAGFSNRIHVDDLVSACMAALTNPEARGVYNVSDGAEMSATDFMFAVARAAQLPEPPEVSMEEAQLTFSAERLSFLNESRRVGNERMLRHLGVSLQYADVNAGIQASLTDAS